MDIETERLHFEAWAKPDDFQKRRKDSGDYSDGAMAAGFAAWLAAVASNIDRSCDAIKRENSYCVDNGDYMLDASECCLVVRGEWLRPEFD